MLLHRDCSCYYFPVSVALKNDNIISRCIALVVRILNAQSSTFIVEIFVPESLGVVKNATWVTIQYQLLSRLQWIFRYIYFEIKVHNVLISRIYLIVSRNFSIFFIFFFLFFFYE